MLQRSTAIAATVAVALLASCSQTAGDGVVASCGALVPAVVERSEGNASNSRMNWRIVRIEKVGVHPSSLEYQCQGLAVLESGKLVQIAFGTTDTHGNQASVYSFEP